MARLIEATTYCPRISGMGRTHFTRYMARIGFAGPVIAFALTVLLSSMAVGQDAPPLPPQSTPAALDAFSSAANLQNNAAFDLASEEWEVFVKTYANDPLIFKAKHYLAVCRLQLKQYAQAEALLTEVVKAPKFELLEESLLNLGYCQYVQARAAQTKGGTNDAVWKQKYTQAADTFRQQLKLFPKSKLADQGLYFQAESWYAIGDFAKATVVYQALLQHFPESSLRGDALYAMGTSFEALKKWSDATNAYSEFLKSFPKDPNFLTVRLRKAEALKQQRQLNEAATIFADLAKTPGFPEADIAAMGEAECLFLLEQFADAAKRYQLIAQRFPKSKYKPEANLAAGKAFYRIRQFPTAVPALQSLIKVGSELQWEAAHWLCRISLAQKQPNQVIELLGTLPAAPAGHEFLVALRLDHADALFDSGKLDQAMANYAEIADRYSRDPHAAQARYNAAVTALQLKRSTDAKMHATRFLADYPKDPLAIDARFVLAESHLMLGAAGEAVALYDQLLKEAPAHPDVPRFALRRAAGWYLQKSYDLVIDDVSQRLSSWKNVADRAQAEYLLGVSYFGKGQFVPASEHLSASIAIDSSWAQIDEAFLFLARAHEKNGKKPLALENLNKLIQKYPKSSLIVEAYYRLGEIQYGSGGFDDAIKSYDEVLKRSPKSTFASFARSGKGWALLKKKAYQASVTEFTQLIATAANTESGHQALLARGMCYRQLKQHDLALKDLNAFLQTAPKGPLASDAWYEKGLTLVSLKQFAPAVLAFEAILKNFPNYPTRDRVWFELAWALKSSGSPKAAGAFGQLVKEFPKSLLAAEAWFQVGEAHYEAKRYTQADPCYRAAQKGATTGELGELVTYKLGWTLYHLEKYSEAIGQFSNQINIYREGSLFADGVFMHGECLFKQEEYAQAWKSFQKAHSFPPRTPQIGALTLLHGAQSASQEKQWDASRKWLTEFVDRYPQSPLVVEARYELGRAAQGLGDSDNARKAWQAAAQTPKSAVAVQAQFMLGELAFGEKKFEEALREYRRAMFRYGAEAAPQDYHAWQARAGFQAARCHEVQIRGSEAAADRIRHLREADRLYRYVLEKYPASDVAEQARKRLAALAQLK